MSVPTKHQGFAARFEQNLAALISHPALQATNKALVAKGIEGFLVGGSPRDAAAAALAGHENSERADLDLCVAASVTQIAAALRSLGTPIMHGAQFGTVAVNVTTPQAQDELVEVTQFRTEVYTEGSRKPSVTKTSDIVADLQRRDFTVNAMAVSLVTGEIVDPFNGLDDLRQGVLRTPADPLVAFSEDPLRVLRLIRFAATRGFSIEDATFAAAAEVSASGALTDGGLSRERCTAELTKILKHGTVDALVLASHQAELVGAHNAMFGPFNSPKVLDHKPSTDVAQHRLAGLFAGIADNERDDAVTQMRFSQEYTKPAVQAARAAEQLDGSYLSAARVVRSSTDLVCDLVEGLCTSDVDSDNFRTARAVAATLRAPLPLNGDMLVASGIKPSPALGKILADAETMFLQNNGELRPEDIDEVIKNHVA